MANRALKTVGGVLAVGALSVSTAFGGATGAPRMAPKPVPSASPNAPTTNYVVVPEPGTEEPLQLENVPLGLRYTAYQAARQYLTDPTFNAAQFDTGSDLASYELAGTSSDNKKFEVDVYPDNTVEEVEIEIEAGDVPRAVTDALKAYFPNYTATTIERSYRPLKNGVTVVYYEFNLETGTNQDVDVEVPADGTQLLIDLGQA